MNTEEDRAVMAGLYHKIAQAAQASDRLPLLTEALALATEADDQEALYALRLCMVDAAHRADDFETSIAAFSWVLERHLSDPARFPMRINSPVLGDLPWMFKWVQSALTSNYAVSIDQVRLSLDSMIDLYKRRNLGESAPAKYRLHMAEDFNETEKLPELLEAVENTPRDDYSDCELCTTAALVSVELDLGRTEAAKLRAAQALAQGKTCLTEPQSMLAHLLIPLLKEGDLETARDYYQRARDRSLSIASARLSCYSDLIVAAAVSDNIGLGLDLFERVLPDLAATIHKHSTRMRFFAHSAVLLSKAEQAGLGQRPIRDTIGVLAAQGLGGDAETVASLAAKLWQAAQPLADAFDRRNGNTGDREWLTAQAALIELTVPLDLGYDDPAPLLISQRAEPQTVADWMIRLRDCTAIGDQAGAIAAANEVLRQADLDPEVRQHALGALFRRTAAQAQLRAGVLHLDELSDPDQAELGTAFDAYLAELTAQSKTDLHRALTVLGLRRYDLDDSFDVTQLRELLAELNNTGAASDVLALVEFQLARQLLRQDEREEHLDELITSALTHELAEAKAADLPGIHLLASQLFGILGHPDALREVRAALACTEITTGMEALCLEWLARLLPANGELVQAAAAATKASHLYLELNGRERAVEAGLLAAALLDDAKDLPGSIAASRRALYLSELLEDFDSTQARLDLGRRLAQSGQAGQALVVLRDLDATLLSRQEPTDSSLAYDCAYWLGIAFANTEDPDRAAAVWEAALGNAKTNNHPRPTAAFGRALGNLFSDYSMWERAVECFQDARAAAVDLDQGAVADLDERLGVCRCFSGDAAGLTQIDSAIQAATELDQPVWVAEWTDTRARSLNALGRIDEAIAGWLQASDAFAALGYPAGRYNTLSTAAQVLVNNDRLAEALALLRPVVAESESEPAAAGLRDYYQSLLAEQE